MNKQPRANLLAFAVVKSVIEFGRGAHDPTVTLSSTGLRLFIQFISTMETSNNSTHIFVVKYHGELF